MSNAAYTSVTVIGAGNIGSAVAQIAVKAGATTQVLAREKAKASAVSPSISSGTIGDPILGEVVVLAVPYGALDEVLSAYPDGLAGKVIIDPTNPIDFDTLDSVVSVAGSSAAAEVAKRLPRASVLKAFNTNFAATLATGEAGDAPTSVLIAGDDAGAKARLTDLLSAAGLRGVDAGPLKRAHELESIGAVQIGLALSEQTPWTGGFAVLAV